MASSNKNRTTIPGSEKKALANAKVIGKVDPDEMIEITVIVRARADGSRADSDAAAERLMKAALELPEKRAYISREEFALQHGADPADIAKVEAFAHEHNLTVIEASVAKRSVELRGTIADLTAAFRPNLKKSKLGRRVIRTRTGGISVPTDLDAIIVAVLGFDDRPVARPHSCFLDPSVLRKTTKSKKESASQGKSEAKGKAATKGKGAANGKGVTKEEAGVAHAAALAAVSLSPRDVARMYDFPSGLDGSGQCIAIIELNDFDQRGKITGTGFSATDLKAYFSSLGLPLPSVTAVGVGGGANVPGPDPNADGEVMLDIEVAGAVAPKAKIAVYFAPNTDKGFLAAIKAAVHDAVRKPSVVSISWGSPEDANTAQSRAAVNQVLQDAAALGVTVCCSAGDDGSSDIADPSRRDGHPHVDFPASSPFALACGGTQLIGSGTVIKKEVVWNERGGATGGGVSNFFPRPAYQSALSVPKSPTGTNGRGVPDVAGDAAPSSGYQVRLVGGKRAVIGGTSAVSPLWAGLVALVNQRLAALGKPPAGFLNPLIYKLGAAAGFHDITLGNNDIEGLGRYAAQTGWDPCTGLGSPDGAKLLKALGG